MKREFTTFNSFEHLLNHLAAQHQTSFLIICSTRSTFLADRTSPLYFAAPPPTLVRLAAARDIHLIYAPTVAHLRAVLSAGTFRITEPQSLPTFGPTVLALVHLIALHAGDGSQGLARTLALAVEVAEATSIDLLVAECRERAISQGDSNEREIEVSSPPADLVQSADATWTPAPDVQPSGPDLVVDPWDVMLPVLAMGTSMVAAGRRARPWAGRTVPARQVAGRWCTWMPIDEIRSGPFGLDNSAAELASTALDGG